MEKKYQKEAIGYRIKLAREQAGLTQEQLAEKIGRSTQFISTIERGVAGPSIETIIRLCSVLHTTSDFLLRAIMPVPTAETITGKLSALSSGQLAAVDKLADGLLELLQVGDE